MSKTRWFNTKCICPRCTDDSQSPRRPAPGETCSLCKGTGIVKDLEILPEREARLLNKCVEVFRVNATRS